MDARIPLLPSTRLLLHLRRYRDGRSRCCCRRRTATGGGGGGTARSWGCAAAASYCCSLVSSRTIFVLSVAALIAQFFALSHATRRHRFSLLWPDPSVSTQQEELWVPQVTRGTQELDETEAGTQICSPLQEDLLVSPRLSARRRVAQRLPDIVFLCNGRTTAELVSCQYAVRSLMMMMNCNANGRLTAMHYRASL